MSTGPGGAPPPSDRSYGGVLIVGLGAVAAGTAVYFLAFQNVLLAVALPVTAILASLAATAIVTRTHDSQLQNLVRSVVDDPGNPDLLDELEEKLLTLPLYEIARTLREMDQSNSVSTEEFAARMRRGRGPMRERIRRSIEDVLEPGGR
jgi:hypothetical protein